MEIFKANHITKRYANHVALDDVSISVPNQSIYGLLGPNGAGKTSLIRIINQITGPDEGELFLNGEKLQRKHIEDIGYLPEERGLYKKMLVGEQALYLAQLKGLSRRDALTQLKLWFEKFEIQSWWNRKVEELSKGMQQKVQFIVTIIHKPKLLIFDEPFSGFDPINVNLLKDEILNLRKNGSTIIFSTHNMGSVEEICDNIALINKSKKILEGSVKEIKHNNKLNIFKVDYVKNSYFRNINENNLFTIAEKIEDDDLISYKIRLADGSVKSNDILTHLIQFGEINSFREILPSMNEIFISKVTSKNEINIS